MLGIGCAVQSVFRFPDLGKLLTLDGRLGEALKRLLLSRGVQSPVARRHLPELGHLQGAAHTAVRRVVAARGGFWWRPFSCPFEPALFTFPLVMGH